MIELIKKGVRSPRDVPPYIMAKILPSSILKRTYDFQSSAIEGDGFYTFEEGGFAGGANTRAEFAAKNYYEVSQIQNVLENIGMDLDNSLEVGAGYGRLSPWIADFSNTHLGIDPNRDAINKARRQYPKLDFEECLIQDFSVNNGPFDLVVTWTVLQHIPPGSIQDAVTTIQSVSSTPSYILVCEETSPEAGNDHTWPRSVNEYNDLFEGQELVEVQNRELEPTYRHQGGKIILFRKC